MEAAVERRASRVAMAAALERPIAADKPGSCRTIPRHAAGKLHPAILASPASSQVRPILADADHAFVDLGPSRPEFGHARPKLVDSGINLAELGRGWAKLAKDGQCCPSSATCCPSSAHIGEVKPGIDPC